ncbi:MAG: acyltransferase [Actinomycetota bacterium]|nr:acyltransferase [Actinomycetota bacterium]
MFGYVPALDGVRGIAIALVLSVHVGDEFLPGGRLGVDLFFVLSGFLITSLLVTEWHATHAISLRAFYRRRALRLFPALFTMLGVYVLVASALALSGRGDLGSSVTAAGFGALYTYNLAAGYFGFMSEGLGHLWSLGQEEQFYLLWPPVLLLTLLCLRARPQSLIVGLWVFVIALLAWRIWLVFGGASGARLYTPDTHSDPILIGCLAGLLYSFGHVTRVPREVAYFCLGTSVAIIATLVEVNSTHHMFGRPLFATAVAIILLAVSLDPRWWLTRLLTVRPLRGLGTISYGLYLWHFPIFFALGWRLGLPISVAVALVSYRFVELPFLRRKTRAPRAQLAPAADAAAASAAPPRRTGWPLLGSPPPNLARRHSG